MANATTCRKFCWPGGAPRHGRSAVRSAQRDSSSESAVSLRPVKLFQQRLPAMSQVTVDGISLLTRSLALRPDVFCGQIEGCCPRVPQLALRGRFSSGVAGYLSRCSATTSLKPRSKGGRTSDPNLECKSITYARDLNSNLEKNETSSSSVSRSCHEDHQMITDIDREARNSDQKPPRLEPTFRRLSMGTPEF